MIFWAGIIVAGLMAALWAKRGLYDTWTFVFNTTVPIYIGIFAEPYAAAMIPSASETPFGDLLVVAGLAVGSFMLLQAISLVFAIGHFTVPFPKFLDITVSGLLGFLIGFVIWNFGAFVIFNMPPFPKDLASQLNYDSRVKEFNVSVFSMPCDILNIFVSNEDECNTQKAVATLFNRADNEIKRKTALQLQTRKTVDPNESKKKVDIKETIGPPPELEQKGT